MAATLADLALEVQELATLSDRLQSFVSAALVADSAADADHMREFQALDLLVQRLHGVAGFVGAIAQSAPKDWRIDAKGAASKILLANLAHRLGGDKSISKPLGHNEEFESGDLELFG